MNLLPRTFRSWIARSFAADFIAGRDSEDGLGYGRAAEFILPREQSGWVRSAIDKKAGEIAATEVEFYDGDKEYDEPRFAAFWAGQPFVLSTGRRLTLDEGRVWAATWADLKGEFFILLRDGWNEISIRPRNPTSLPPLLLARPDCMRHIIAAGTIVGWAHTDAGGRQETFLPEAVIHVPFISTGEQFRGSAPVDAIFNAAASDYLAGVYVKNLMRNNGDQGVFVLADGNLDEPQKQQIIASLREKQRKARRGEFSIGFLGGPAKFEIQDAKAQAPGADLTAARLASRHEIYIGLGVPASMADIKASYSTGASSDRYQLITGTCISLANFIDSALNRPASILAGRPLTACADWDDHPVMVEARQARIDTASKLWGMGMPIKNANDYLGLGMDSFPGWDVGYLPFAVNPVDAKADPVSDPALAEPVDTTPADPAVEQLRLVLLARQRANRAAPVCAKLKSATDAFVMFQCNHGGGIEQKARDPKQLAIWKEHMNQRRATVQLFKSKFGRELMKARGEVLGKITSSYRPAEKSALSTLNSQLSTKAAAADFLFDLGKFTDGLLAAMRKAGEVALDTAGSQLFKEIGRDDPFKFPPEAVLEYARARENKLSNVPKETHDRIKETLEAGITKGDTTEELATRVRAEFNGIDQGRARVIATTETSAAYGAGRDEAMQQAGIGFKQWLTSGNDNVRAAHAAANEQIVGIDEMFEVGGEQLQYPGDPAGAPENVINCHCVSIPVETAEG